jgi:hypothetical protein
MTEHFKAFKKVDEIFELFFEKANGVQRYIASLAIPRQPFTNTGRDDESGLPRPDGNNYMLGNRILQLSGLMIKTWNSGMIALPHLTELRNKDNETIHLTSLYRDQVIYIECLPSNPRFEASFDRRCDRHALTAPELEKPCWHSRPTHTKTAIWKGSSW